MIFLSEAENNQIQESLRVGDRLMGRFFTALQSRVQRRAATPGIMGLHADAHWWYPAAEYVSDAAMLHALQPEESTGIWLRDVSLSIARRPASDWVGPWFRDHRQPYTGHLETAHLCWALSAALDLGADVFTSGEKDEIRENLYAKGITLCRRWLDQNSHLANWRAIMASGTVVAAAALGEKGLLEQYVPELILCAEAFQPDGSYAESLQYGNYLAFALMMAYESLHRQYPDFAVQLSVSAYAKGLPWIVSSMLYQKPLSGWGAQPRARAINFNDSAATFRPSGDLLLHVAARCRESLPTEAGLARWLFDEYYANVPDQQPDNIASFGLRNDWGFLTLPLLGQSARAIAPQAAEIPLTAGFSNGNAFIRDAWTGDTVIGIQGGGDALCGPGHLHGDLNSFMLVHNRERLLVDPGHSCYRNLIHGLESASQTHNTCTFLIEQDSLGLQEDLAKAKLLEQHSLAARRKITGGKAGPPVNRGGKRLILARSGDFSVIGSEVSALYGPPIREFSRFWLAAGSHVLFVVDRIRTDQPVITIWNWLLNNRGETSDIRVVGANEIRMLRQAAGMRIFHGGSARLNGPVYGYVHDAYHPEPNQVGEGKPGSGWLFRWTEARPETFRTVVHAFALDDYGLIDRWQYSQPGHDSYTLSKGPEKYTLRVHSTEPLHLELQSPGNTHQIREGEGDVYIV